MSTISRWVIPCSFIEEGHKVDPIEFDFTEHLKLMLSNEIWNRKFDYGFSNGLKNTDKGNIDRAVIIIYPSFIQGTVNKKRIPQLIEKSCGKIPAYLKIDSYKDWSYNNGFAIIEVEYKYSINNIPNKNDLYSHYIPNIETEFLETFDRFLSIAKEISALFLACLHLCFPTKSVILHNDSPINDGFFQVYSNKKTYCRKIISNSFMHAIFIETSKISIVNSFIGTMASIWHYNLWSLKRYLNAVKSDQISMDSLLDLIYALEGLFEKSASSGFIKTICMLLLCGTRKEAKSIKNLLDKAYYIRNDIAHGERSYDSFDYVTFEGKEVLAQTIYWEMKSLVAIVIREAIQKLIRNQGMKNLRFNEDDLISLMFKK